MSRADRACALANKKLFALGPGLLDARRVHLPQLPRAAAYLDKLVAIGSQMQGRIAALGRPRSGGAARDALVSALKKYISALRHAAIAAHEGNLREFRSAYALVAPRGLPTGREAKRLSRAMRRFRFTDCGKATII